MVALLRTILGNAVNDATTFRTRFRFRVLKTLDIKEHEYRFKVGEREVVLSPLPEGVPIRESEWLVINVRGFDSEDAARTFAHKLRAASEISSVAARLGIDAGRDLPTGGFGQTVKDHFQKTTGLLLRDNIHGIDVFLDDPNVRIAQINLTAQVWKEPNPFLSDLGLFLDVADKTSDKTQDVILLLNYALMRSDPVAQIVFAVSAVEMLVARFNQFERI
jgi:hypothetical protein